MQALGSLCVAYSCLLNKTAVEYGGYIPPYMADALRAFAPGASGRLARFVQDCGVGRADDVATE